MKFFLILTIFIINSFARATTQIEAAPPTSEPITEAQSTTGKDLSITEKLIAQQKLLEQKLETLNIENLPDDLLISLRVNLKQMIDKRSALIGKLERDDRAAEQSGYRSSLRAADYNFEQFYLSVFDQLMKSKKIKFISPELTAAFGLQEYLCRQQYQCGVNPQKSCKILKAFYLPLVDQIFIDPSLSRTEYAAAIFHEVQHAFQYRYRFPLDMAYLIDLSTLEKPQVKREEILSYLSLIYETQASWYEIQGHQPERWMQTLSMSGAALYWTQRLGHAVVASLWHWAKLLVPGKTGSQPGLQSFNDILPIHDKIRIHNRGLPAMYPPNSPNALYFKEIVLFGQPGLLNLVGNLDIGFHKRLTQAIECNYYGKLNFLFETMSGNQAVVAQAHNLFYTNFLGVREYKVPHCESELSADLLSSKKSPLVYWLTKDLNEIPTICKPAYSHWEKFHQEQAHTIYSLHQSSPFNLIAAGVEGGTGGLDITPNIFFYPQLEVDPLPIPQIGPESQPGGPLEH